MSLVCQRCVFMSVILQIFRIHHWNRQKKTPLNIREKWKEGGWFFRQLSIMLLAEEQNWSLTSTNASQKTLIFLKSTFNTCPDLMHMVVRSVESDLKLHVDSMLLLKDHAAICRLECNITDRNVKPPRFKFEIVEKLCKAVSLSFRDAEVIISDCNKISDYGRSDCPIFEGVYSFETPHVYKADQTTSTTSYNVLISLVDGLLTSNSNLFTSYLICFDRENSKMFQSVKISMRFITSQLYVFSVIVRWRHTNWNWIFYSDFLRKVSFCLHFITWQKELKKATTRQPKTTIRRKCVMVAMMLGTCHPVISIFTFPSTVQLIYVLQSLRHLNLTGSCMEKPTWQRRILKFAVNPFQNLNLTILELKTCLEVCTLSFLEHTVTWKKLKRVLRRRSLKMEEMLFPM